MADAIDDFATRHGLDHRARAQLFELLEAELADQLGGASTIDVSLLGSEPPAVGPETAAPSASSPIQVGRYTELGLLGVGASSVVHRVRDHHLGRTLARKRLRSEHLQRPNALARFEHERRIPELVQHPGIVAVFDHGVLEDGRPWFTMQEVRGTTLRRAIADLHASAESAHLGQRRLITGLLGAVQAVAYAHTLGVLHRDLKTDNIMVGAFGEVLVLDWGLARALGQPEGLASGATEPQSVGTRHGSCLGTPGYMSPEQAAGRVADHGPPTDVYGLGAVLYELLEGRAPPRVEQRADERLSWSDGVDEALKQLTEQALRFEPGDRFADAGDLADALGAWLDGTLSRRQAVETLERARQMKPELMALKAKAEALAQQATNALGDVPLYAPVHRKLRAWGLEDEAARLRRQAEVLEATRLQGLRAAVGLDPQLEPVHTELAAYYREQLAAAEALPGAPGAAAAETHLRAHHRGPEDDFLRGQGRALLFVDPPGARVLARRLVEKERRLVPGEAVDLGPAPLKEVVLKAGSWLFEVSAPGHLTTLVPVVMTRGGRWSSALGDEQPEASPVALPREAPTGAESCFVAPGWFGSGGDPDAPDGEHAQRVYVPGFFMGRHPVTVGEYLGFANALVARGQRDRALAVAPQGLHQDQQRPLWRWQGDRIEAVVDELGQVWPERWPVTQVDHASAVAYAAWLAETTGHPWRLPGEYEWEKAARGVDRRRWPWGHHFDPTWTSSMHSSRTAPDRYPVDDWPEDISVYGVRGCGGNVRDWCADLWLSEGARLRDGVLQVQQAPPGDPGHRSVRGGSYTSSDRFCAVAGRFGMLPDRRYRVVGFRVCCPWV